MQFLLSNICYILHMEFDSGLSTTTVSCTSRAAEQVGT